MYLFQLNNSPYHRFIKGCCLIEAKWNIEKIHGRNASIKSIEEFPIEDYELIQQFKNRSK